MHWPSIWNSIMYTLFIHATYAEIWHTQKKWNFDFWQFGSLLLGNLTATLTAPQKWQYHSFFTYEKHNTFLAKYIEVFLLFFTPRQPGTLIFFCSHEIRVCPRREVSWPNRGTAIHKMLGSQFRLPLVIDPTRSEKSLRGANPNRSELREIGVPFSVEGDERWGGENKLNK